MFSVKDRTRLLLLISDEYEDKKGEVILHNAETIRVVGENGEPISVLLLKEGDKILVNVDTVGRHFGMRLQEEIQEK